MELDSRLLLLEGSPGKKRQAKVDCGRVKGIDGLVQLQSQVFVAIKQTGPVDKDSGKIGIDAPVAMLVRVGQGAAGDPAAEAAMIKPAGDRSEADFDVAQALSEGQLGEGETQELVPTRKALDLIMTAVARHAAIELMSGDKIHELREDRTACVHRPLLSSSRA